MLALNLFIIRLLSSIFWRPLFLTKILIFVTFLLLLLSVFDIFKKEERWLTNDGSSWTVLFRCFYSRDLPPLPHISLPFSQHSTHCLTDQTNSIHRLGFCWFSRYFWNVFVLLFSSHLVNTFFSPFSHKSHKDVGLFISNIIKGLCNKGYISHSVCVLVVTADGQCYWREHPIRSTLMLDSRQAPLC